MRHIALVVVVFAGCANKGFVGPGWYSRPPLPSPHGGHGTCGDSMIVGGTGASTDVLVLQDGSSEWLGSAPLAIGRTDPSCIEVPVGHDPDVYVFGGAPGVPGEVRRAGSHTWTVLGSPAPFETGAALILREGKIFAFGGDGHHTNVYDPLTDAWSQVAPEPLARKFAGVSFDDKAGYLIVGGRDQDDPEQRGITRIEHYDPATDRWTVDTLELPEPLVDAVAENTAVGLLVVGRIEVAPGRFLGRTEVADPATADWTQGQPMNPLRRVWGGAGGEITVVGGAVTEDGIDTPSDQVDGFLPYMLR